ncbi:MAG: hypothetical protein Sapg2KO_19270 [Saprospiraceae bacterium]
MEESKSIPYLRYTWITGFWIWLLFIVLKGIPTPQRLEWVQLLLVFAPLVVVPFGLQLGFKSSNLYLVKPIYSFPVALMFTLAFYFEPGLLAGALAATWLIYTSTLFLQAFQHRKVLSIYQLASLLFLVVGAAWSLADRMAFQPMGFDAVIVLLTGAHFHYAGFALVLLCELLKERKPHLFKNWIGLLVLAGIPAVALGITGSHFNWPIWVETLAGLIMAAGGLGLSVLHLKVATSDWQHLISWLFIVGALALFVAMVLAGLYALRAYFPLSFLSIPWMYAVHGSLNTFGTSFLLFLAWHFQKKSLPLR